MPPADEDKLRRPPPAPAEVLRRYFPHLKPRTVSYRALKATGTRAPLLTVAEANARWSVNFVHDEFAQGRRFRIFNVIDDATKECLAAVVDTSISGRRIARELTALIARRGKPRLIVSDHVLCQERIAV